MSLQDAVRGQATRTTAADTGMPCPADTVNGSSARRIVGRQVIGIESRRGSARFPQAVRRDRNLALEAVAMSEVLRPLMLDLVAFVVERPRSYAEVMEAWRTSCPRLTVWEDALEARLVVLRDGLVHATEAGRRALAAR